LHSKRRRCRWSKIEEEATMSRITCGHQDV
jgi:hypothetical protein